MESNIFASAPKAASINNNTGGSQSAKTANTSANITSKTKQQNKKAMQLPTLDMLFDKKNRLFLIGIVGILIIFLSDLIFGAHSNSGAASYNTADNADAFLYEKTLESAEIYIDNIEKELIATIEGIYGTGSVDVMITIETAGETVYARSEKSSTQTQQAEQGVIDEQTSFESEYTIIDGGDKDTPIVEMHTLPEIKGVAIVCEGGDDITVISDITELVSVVLGVPTNRICVLGREPAA